MRSNAPADRRVGNAAVTRVTPVAYQRILRVQRSTAARHSKLISGRFQRSMCRIYPIGHPGHVVGAEHLHDLVTGIGLIRTALRPTNSGASSHFDPLDALLLTRDSACHSPFGF